MEFNLELEALGLESRQRAEKLLAAFDQGAISLDQLRAAIHDLLMAANVKGAASGLVSINRELWGGSKAAELGAGSKLVELYGKSPILRKSLNTIFDGPVEQLAMKLQRLAEGTGIQAAQETRGKVIRDSKAIGGWIRGLDSDPCQLCKWWSRDGRIWEKWRALQTHTGCTCYQRPVTVKEYQESTWGNNE